MRICGLLTCQGRSRSEKNSQLDASYPKDSLKMQKDCNGNGTVHPGGFRHERGGLWLQFAAAFSVCISLMACGSHMGWTSPALPHLQRNGSEFPVTNDEKKWIVSLYTQGSVVGSIISPFIVDRLGRKTSFIIFSLPQLAGWLLIVFAQSPVVLYVARVTAGIAHGGIYNVAIIYFAEIADKRIRGAFGTFLKMSTNVGSLFVSTLGAYVSYHNLNLISLSLPIIFILTFVLMPETPYFFLLKRRDDEATRSLMRLRRLKNPESVKKDIDLMRSAMDQNERSILRALKELLCSHNNRRGLWILMGLKFTQQMSGHMAIVGYTQEIFEYANSTLIPAGKAVVLLGIAQLIAAIVGATLIDKVGRRLLIIVSGCSAAVSLVFVGLFFYLKFGVKHDVSGITWLPIAAVIMYEVTVALGIGTIPYVILGEIFPTNVKGSAVSLGMVVGSGLGAMVSFVFPLLNDWLGLYFSFWMFAACCLGGTLWVYIITPETKGKTLEEIQDLLNPRQAVFKTQNGSADA